MKNKFLLQRFLNNFSGVSESDFQKGSDYWYTKTIKKGEFFNMQNFVCTDLGFITKGIFRIYYFDEEKMEERNMFFFSEEQFIVSFRSFIHQYPCIYFIEAIEDAEIIAIKYNDLYELYQNNKAWANFGRQLAELFFEYSQVRMEELLFNSPEQRYIKLLEKHPKIVERVALYHISSFLGIKNPSLSRIRKRLSGQ